MCRDKRSTDFLKQTLEREQNERDVLEALGDYNCDDGMSVENVPAVANINTLKGRFIAHKFSSVWAEGFMMFRGW